MHFRTSRQHASLSCYLSFIVDRVSTQQMQWRVRRYEGVEVLHLPVFPPESGRSVGIDGEADYLVEVVHGSAATGYRQERCLLSRPRSCLPLALVHRNEWTVPSLASDVPTTWKDADPEIPIFKQAKAEYAELR